jgi:hypothetical protein
MIATRGFLEGAFPWIIECIQSNRVSIRILPRLLGKAPATSAN